MGNVSAMKTALPRRLYGPLRFHLTLLAITGVGGFLRFWELDLCFWFKDCADVFSRLLYFVEEGHLPLRGINTSLGAARPPGFLWLMSLPAFVRADPVFVTGFVSLMGTLAVFVTGLAGRSLAGRRAGLLAAALMAVSPWPVVMSRNLWPQCALPLFSCVLLWLCGESSARHPHESVDCR